PLLSVRRPAPPQTCSLSLHDALPILPWSKDYKPKPPGRLLRSSRFPLLPSFNPASPFFQSRHYSLPLRGSLPLLYCFLKTTNPRSEEHTSELQSRENLVCRLLLEQKK